MKRWLDGIYFIHRCLPKIKLKIKPILNSFFYKMRDNLITHLTQIKNAMETLMVLRILDKSNESINSISHGNEPTARCSHSYDGLHFLLTLDYHFKIRKNKS